jgi:hypothetical protein
MAPKRDEDWSTFGSPVCDEMATDNKGRSFDLLTNRDLGNAAHKENCGTVLRILMSSARHRGPSVCPGGGAWKPQNSRHRLHRSRVVVAHVQGSA